MENLVIDRCDEFFDMYELISPGGFKVLDANMLIKPPAFFNDQKLREAFNISGEQRKNLAQRPYSIISISSITHLLFYAIYALKSKDSIEEIGETILQANKKYYSFIKKQVQAKETTYPASIIQRVINKLNRPKSFEHITTADRLDLEELATKYYHRIAHEHKLLVEDLQNTHPGLSTYSTAHNMMMTYFLRALLSVQTDPKLQVKDNHQVDGRILADAAHLSWQYSKPVALIVGDPQYSDIIISAVKSFSHFFFNHLNPALENRGFDLTLYTRYKSTSDDRTLMYKTLSMHHAPIYNNPYYKKLYVNRFTNTIE